VGGGGPIQVPPGVSTPGQVGGGGDTGSPFAALTARLDTKLASSTPAQKAELEKVRATIQQAETEAGQVGAYNPVTLLKVDASISRAMASPDKLPALDTMLADADVLQAEFVKAGSHDPAKIAALSARVEAARI
jgi:hypothetical protein